MDVNTLRDVIDEVHATLDIRIDSLVLDSGYASRDVIGTYGSGQNDSLIVRMPGRKGYPYKTLYHQLRRQFDQPKYIFVRENSVYYGRQKSITLFGVDLFAYVYVDKKRALEGLRDFMKKHVDQYDQMFFVNRNWLFPNLVEIPAPEGRTRRRRVPISTTINQSGKEPRNSPVSPRKFLTKRR